MIVKVQLPLYSSESGPPALIYNQDHSVYGFMPVTPEIVEAMAGDEKAYFHADVKGDRISLKGRAEIQDW